MSPNRTLEDLLDHQDVCDLLYRYATALDEKNWKLLSTCFTEDAVADYGEVIGRKEGYQAIEDTCRAALGNLDSSQHIVTNPEVEIQGDEARTRCYVHAQHTKAATKGGDNYTIGGTYTDVIVRSPDGWRIQKRELKILWQEGNQGVLA